MTVADTERAVKERYGEGAQERVADLCCPIDYDPKYLEAIPQEVLDRDYGCGDPSRFLNPGETVLDLGSGTGKICFIAAQVVGPTGRVIGIDMTDAMLEKARENARKTGLDATVEFRKGNIEALPIEDESVDAIISNCVINLSPQKDRVYAEAFRVLRPGGRIMISDVVLERPLPEAVLDSIDAYIGCVGGASLRGEYLETIAKAGFGEVRVEREASFIDAISFDDPPVREAIERAGISEEQARGYADAVTSLHIFASK
jgi:SAM-dependent methyltransferase